MNLSRPLVCLDIESTGPRPDTDRIVELALVVLRPDGSRERERVRRGRVTAVAGSAVRAVMEAA